MTPQRHIEILELDAKPIDPNKAKIGAVLLSLAGLVIALTTIKSNIDYFGQYYEGFGYYLRVFTFMLFEATIVALPLAIGWGNWSQTKIALVAELILIPLGFTHTYLVSEGFQAKLQATKVKAEATADYDKRKADADQITADNNKAQSNYQAALREWRRAVADARYSGAPVPAAPQSPVLREVPKIGEAVAAASLLSVENAGEQTVSHSTLLKLLWLMLGGVVFAWVAIVKLSDSVKVRNWLLRRKATDLERITRGGQTVSVSQPLESVEAVSVPQSNRVSGFAPQSVSQSVKRSGSQSVRLANGLLNAVPLQAGGYSLQTASGVYLCYAGKRDLEKLGSLRTDEALRLVRGKVDARAEKGNKADALAALNSLT